MAAVAAETEAKKADRKAVKEAVKEAVLEGEIPNEPEAAHAHMLEVARRMGIGGGRTDNPEEERS